MAKKDIVQLSIRMKESLHQMLLEYADRSGLSINSIVIELLARGVGWDGILPKSLKPWDEIERRSGAERRDRQKAEIPGGKL